MSFSARLQTEGAFKFYDDLGPRETWGGRAGSWYEMRGIKRASPTAKEWPARACRAVRVNHAVVNISGGKALGAQWVPGFNQI